MTVVFDAEPLLAFSFDEPGAADVERWLDRVYDGEVTGYVTTINLAEFRYISTRKTTVNEADAHINDLREMGLDIYNVDDLWKMVSDLKANYNPSIADAFALAAAKSLDNNNENDVTLLVGADTDYDMVENEDEFQDIIVRFREDAA